MAGSKPQIASSSQSDRMETPNLDTRMRVAAFEHVRRLNETHDHLTTTELKPGFLFSGERIPLINPQRGIFKPQQMRFLLSIKTVFPKPGGKVWYDDQREVHRQIFNGDETVDYAFMGKNPDAADNRWLREAFENQTPIIYFLGIAPGRYQALLPTFISGWDGQAQKPASPLDLIRKLWLLQPTARSGDMRSARSNSGCTRLLSEKR
jgi:putative restriction endonuclease